MASENKNINELVSDDEDATAELEAITERQFFGRKTVDSDAESELKTYNFSEHDEFEGVSMSELKAGLRRRSDTIEKLQFDIEQLRAKWLGLETEIKAREELTSNVSAELKSAERKLERKEKLLDERELSIKSLQSEIREREQAYRELQKTADEAEELTGKISAELESVERKLESKKELVDERDRSIKLLQAEIREREQAYRNLQKTADEAQAAREELEHGDEITEARNRIAQQEGALASARDELQAARDDQSRTEDYADGLRRQLADIASTTDKAINDCVSAKTALKEFETRYRAMENETAEAQRKTKQAESALDKAQHDHEQEIRTLRFELGEAQQTLSERDVISEQLASDLVDSRYSNDQLERDLKEVQVSNQARIEELEQLNAELEKNLAEHQEQLDSKSNAINALLAELAKKSSEIDSIGEMEDVIQEIDDRMSERIEENGVESEAERLPADRTARLLIGRIDDQELRFPLFKNRLTIGRTQQNDIQLKAAYISRRHAVVETEGDTTRVIDWGSKNGVLVNKKRITEHFLKNGDILTIGNAEFRYEERPKRDS